MIQGSLTQSTQVERVSTGDSRGDIGRFCEKRCRQVGIAHYTEQSSDNSKLKFYKYSEKRKVNILSVE